MADTRRAFLYIENVVLDALIRGLGYALLGILWTHHILSCIVTRKTPSQQ
jgi:hypothetical protein